MESKQKTELDIHSFIYLLIIVENFWKQGLVDPSGIAAKRNLI